MKMHDKQQFNISGVAWQFSKSDLPQGVLTAKASNGNNICSIRPADWSKPLWAQNNAVLMTRSSQGGEWRETAPMSVRDAIKKGTERTQNYNQDRQIAAMAYSLQNGPKQSLSSNNNLKLSKPLKGRAAIKAMQAATEFYQDGAHHNNQRQKQQSNDQGMG